MQVFAENVNVKPPADGKGRRISRIKTQTFEVMKDRQVAQDRKITKTEVTWTWPTVSGWKYYFGLTVQYPGKDKDENPFKPIVHSNLPEGREIYRWQNSRK